MCAHRTKLSHDVSELEGKNPHNETCTNCQHQRATKATERTEQIKIVHEREKITTKSYGPLRQCLSLTQ